MLFGVFFTGAGNDLQPRVEPAGSENDVEICRVRGSGRNQPPRALDASSTQRVLLGRISDKHQILATVTRGFSFVLLDNDKWCRTACEFPRGAAAYAPCAANDVMVAKAADFTFHFPPTEEASQ